MTDDLVKRIEEHGLFWPGGLAKEAADRIKKLEAALEKIAQHDMQAIAMDALRPGERIREKTDD
jgi:hypothetical protein